MRRAASVVIALTLCGAGAWVAPAGAATSTDPTPICSPTPQEPSSFCVTSTLSLTAPGSDPATDTHDAAGPANLTLKVANTSPGHDGDGSSTVWLDQIELNVLSGLDGGPTLAAHGLPNNLIVAGSTAGCAPNGADFSSCTAGTGTFFANVTGTQFDDGLHSGTFGIQKIVNISPAPDGTTMDWQVTVDYCVAFPMFQQSCLGGAQESTFDITTPAGGLPSSSSGSTVDLPMTTPSFSPFPGVTVDPGAIDTMTLNINGTSDQVDGAIDPLNKARTVVSLPTFCGSAHSLIAFTDRADAAAEANGDAPQQQLLQELPYTVSGCPTAKIAFNSAHITRATLDASASTAKVDGRTIAKYMWFFGDGTNRTTTSPTVNHTYATSADHKVFMYAVDSAGAFSVGTTTVKGSTLSFGTADTTVHKGDTVKFTGRLRHGTNGLGGRPVQISRCATDGTSCKAFATLTTATQASRRGSFSIVLHPTATAIYAATFVGGNGFLGSRQEQKVYVH